MSTQLSTPLRRVSVLATDQVFASTLMQAKDFFHLASLRHGKQLGQGFNASFETRLVSPDNQPVGSFSNVTLPVDGGLDDADIIILPAFWGDFDTLCERYPQVMPWLREQHARGAVLCAAATGVFWLAEAGLLDGKEATTYWRFFNTFAERFPQVNLNQDKHLTDADNLYCAGGPTSACDLYIYLIERFCGANIAQAVARDILYEVQRNYSPGRIGFGGQKLHQDHQLRRGLRRRQLLCKAVSPAHRTVTQSIPATVPASRLISRPFRSLARDLMIIERSRAKPRARQSLKAYAPESGIRGIASRAGGSAYAGTRSSNDHRYRGP